MLRLTRQVIKVRYPSNMIWRNLGLIALFLIGCLLLTMLWLRWYSHHGQSLVLPDYLDSDIYRAVDDAADKSFEIRVIDSVFIVGKEGGIIIDQNPKPGSLVKQRRKIYVTLSKEQADQIPSRRLPVLYGKSYERKKRELKQGFELNTRVVGRRYDPGAPDHILEVSYKGETIINSDRRRDNIMIDKGGTLDVILSKSTGGSLDMPSLTCRSYDEVVFQLQTLDLVIGEAVEDPTVTNQGSAYVWRQEPEAASRIYTGDTVKVYLTQDRPLDCTE